MQRKKGMRESRGVDDINTKETDDTRDSIRVACSLAHTLKSQLTFVNFPNMGHFLAKKDLHSLEQSLFSKIIHSYEIYLLRLKPLDHGNSLT